MGKRSLQNRRNVLRILRRTEAKARLARSASRVRGEERETTTNYQNVSFVLTVLILVNLYRETLREINQVSFSNSRSTGEGVRNYSGSRPCSSLPLSSPQPFTVSSHNARPILWGGALRDETKNV